MKATYNCNTSRLLCSSKLLAYAQQQHSRGDYKVIESRKQAVSIRMSPADLSKIKDLARRLSARDSDVIRFAVKTMLGRLAPLFDPHSRGRALVPALVEVGTEFLRFFELDSSRLDALINGEVSDPEKRVSMEDLGLLALAGVKEPYAALKLSELNQTDERLLRSGDLTNSIRQYLYEKYVYRISVETDQSASPLRFALRGTQS